MKRKSTYSFIAGCLLVSLLFSCSGKQEYDGCGIENIAGRTFGFLSANSDTISDEGIQWLLSSYDKDNRLNGITRQRDSVTLQSAIEIANKYNLVVGCIVSRDTSLESSGGLIVDLKSLKEANILLKASKISGRSDFQEMALTHFNTALSSHFKPDYTVYDAVCFNACNGKKLFVCGAAHPILGLEESQTLYELVTAAQITHNVRLIMRSEDIAAEVIKRLENSSDVVDSHTASILSSALAKLRNVSYDDTLTSSCRSCAEKIIFQLSKEKDNYTDYYYLEALLSLTNRI